MNKNIILLLLISAANMNAREPGLFESLGALFDKAMEESEAHRSSSESLSFSAEERDDALVLTINNIDGKNLKAEKADNRLSINTDNTKIVLSVDGAMVSVQASYQQEVIKEDKKEGEEKPTVVSRSYSSGSLTNVFPASGKLLLNEIMKDSKKHLKFKDRTLTISIPLEKKEKQSLEIDIDQEENQENK